MRHRREILDTYRRGDRLSDDELEFLQRDMQAIADAVSGYGDLFTLQFAYAQRVADDCRSFRESRRESAKRAAERAQLAEAFASIDNV